MGIATCLRPVYGVFVVRVFSPRRTSVRYYAPRLFCGQMGFRALRVFCGFPTMFRAKNHHTTHGARVDAIQTRACTVRTHERIVRACTFRTVTVYLYTHRHSRAGPVLGPYDFVNAVRFQMNDVRCPYVRRRVF